MTAQDSEVKSRILVRRNEYTGSADSKKEGKDGYGHSPVCRGMVRSSYGCPKGKNVCKSGVKSLIRNRGRMGPACWGQDLEI